MYKLYLTVFTRNRWAECLFILRYIVMHCLVTYFTKSAHQNVMLRQNTLSHNKVKYFFLGRNKTGFSY